MKNYNTQNMDDDIWITEGKLYHNSEHIWLLEYDFLVTESYPVCLDDTSASMEIEINTPTKRY